MTIAFYKVDNSLNYGRHEFDNLYDQPQEVIEMLDKLPDGEVKFYNSNKYDWTEKEPTLADFEEDYNDEELDGGWWCVVLQPKEKTLESMVSTNAYNEIVLKVKEEVGQDVFDIVWPSIKKALEYGNGKIREKILIEWLNVDSMRVCSYCGKIMEKGWYLNMNGYACSDECAAESEGITMEEFDKWQIYKDDIISYLEDEGEGRKIEDLTKEECDKILEEIADGLDYFYTEWC